MKLQEHPLWPTIKRWVETTPPPIVAFGSPQEFDRNVELAALANPLFGHLDWKVDIWQTYIDASLIGSILVGHSCDSETHALLYHSAEHRVGRLLCYAAQVAVANPGICSVFGESTQREGFVAALEAWTSLVLPTVNVSDALTWVCHDLVGKDELVADFCLKVCQDVIGDSAAYTATIREEISNADAAARMRERRGLNPKTSKYKDWIQCFWIPAAFWCKDNAEIVKILDPDRKEKMTDAYDRVRRDITALGLASSRRKSS